MFISANPLVFNRRRIDCHVDVEERRKQQNRMILVRAVAGKNTRIAVGNRLILEATSSPPFFDKPHTRLNTGQHSIYSILAPLTAFDMKHYYAC
jgi:hypothetical protein